jgi:predicted dithiol-disulfide oxidoreductase (DUF899 family)
MTPTFPGESPEYRVARDRLLGREVELRRTLEAVAGERRALPPGGVVPGDYVFRSADRGPSIEVRLSELFASGKDSLIVYNMMFPRHAGDDRPGPTGCRTAQLALADSPCPSCTSLIDQLEGAAEHVAPRANLVIVAKAPADHLADFVEERGWRRLRFLSSARNTYNRDYHGENEDGSQMPMLNVFHRDGDTIRHFWGAELLFAPTDPNQDPRHVGTIEPLWNLFDLIPEGRGVDWDEQLDYPCRDDGTSE